MCFFSLLPSLSSSYPHSLLRSLSLSLIFLTSLYSLHSMKLFRTVLCRTVLYGTVCACSGLLTKESPQLTQSTYSGTAASYPYLHLLKVRTCTYICMPSYVLPHYCLSSSSYLISSYSDEFSCIVLYFISYSLFISFNNMLRLC
jgi:hypothetical protein